MVTQVEGLVSLGIGGLMIKLLLQCNDTPIHFGCCILVEYTVHMYSRYPRLQSHGTQTRVLFTPPPEAQHRYICITFLPGTYYVPTFHVLS